MKINEKKIRETIREGRPFTIITDAGERVKVQGNEWIFLPPLQDENDIPLFDETRSDFFQVWGNGENYRWIAFRTANLIEAKHPKDGEKK